KTYGSPEESSTDRECADRTCVEKPLVSGTGLAGLTKATAPSGRSIRRGLVKEPGCSSNCEVYRKPARKVRSNPRYRVFCFRTNRYITQPRLCAACSGRPQPRHSIDALPGVNRLSEG